MIKDALLELEKADSFEKITVAAVCKRAEITRATFYLHYDNLTAVLDEVLEDALRVAEHASEDRNQDMLHMLELMTREKDAETLSTHDTLLPACQRVADQPKYRPLFLDESLSAYIIKKMYLAEKDNMIPLLMTQCGLSRQQAEKVFMFVIYGAYAVNKSMRWQKTREWFALQGTLTQFILGGFDALRQG